MKTKYFLLIIITFFIFPYSYGQYSISGYIDTEQKNKTVYLSLLRYDEQYTISNTQIILSTKTDSMGYFEFKGQLLSEKDKFYRIHANIKKDKSALQLVSSDSVSNYHNFIFSNNDTIFFPKTKSFWFRNSKNTNIADKDKAGLINFIHKLSQELAHSRYTTDQVINDFASRIKQYTCDSISSPLVKLLAVPVIKRNSFNLRNDFEKNPIFYKNIQQNLFDDYGRSSYYLQFQDEISTISYSVIYNKYHFHKIWNYILITLVSILILLVFFFFRKIKLLKKEIIQDCSQTLTQQEEKIAKLICENKTNKEIADELFISLSTVKTHISNLYSKVNITNRKDFQHKFKNHTWY